MPPRTRRRRGHIEPLPSGHFRAVVFTGIDPLTRRRRYVKATCATRAAAEQELTRLQREVDENKHPKAAITLAEAVEKWMEVAELEETTRDRYEDLIRLYILPTFGDLQIGRLDAELMERFYCPQDDPPCVTFTVAVETAVPAGTPFGCSPTGGSHTAQRARPSTTA